MKETVFFLLKQTGRLTMPAAISQSPIDQNRPMLKVNFEIRFNFKDTWF